MTGKDRFLWGVSTSGYQHEGGYNQPGQPLNNWCDWEARRLIPSSGRGADFWNRYEGDLALCRGMGLNAFRMGIEWARVQPVFQRPDRPMASQEVPWDEAAAEHYAEILSRAREQGLEPLVTLHHFTDPLWLGEDAWLNPETTEAFLRYTEWVLTRVNTRLASRGLPALRWLLTINEPNMLTAMTYHLGTFPSERGIGIPRGARAYARLLETHVRAYDLIHRLYREHPEWGVPMVSFNNYCSDLFWNDAAMLHLLAAPVSGVGQPDVEEMLRVKARLFGNHLRDEALPFEWSFWQAMGTLVKTFNHLIAPTQIRMEPFRNLLDFLYERQGPRPFDYIAFDYYDPFVGHSFRFPRFHDLAVPSRNWRDWLMHGMTSKCWDWRILPEGMRFFTRYYARHFPSAPIVIAENGMAHYRNGPKLFWRRTPITRSCFLRAHVGLVQQLRQEGLPLAGYFHWSLTDNYEWGTYAARFGLYELDFEDESLARRAVNSLGDNAPETYASLIRRD